MTRRVFIPEVGWQDEVIYTEKDMEECWKASMDYNKPAGFDSGICFKDFLEKIRNINKRVLPLQNDSLL